MPLTGTALARTKLAQRNRKRRRPLQSDAKTRVRRVREAVAAGDEQLAARLLGEACKRLDRAVTRGALHKRNAARRKSRLHRAFNRAFGVQSTEGPASGD